MGEVILGDFGDLDAKSDELMRRVFSACDDSEIDPEYVCMMMITTFGNTLFQNLCQDHALQHLQMAVFSICENNNVVFENN